MRNFPWASRICAPRGVADGVRSADCGDALVFDDDGLIGARRGAGHIDDRHVGDGEVVLFRRSARKKKSARSSRERQKEYDR